MKGNAAIKIKKSEVSDDQLAVDGNNKKAKMTLKSVPRKKSLS